MKFGWWGITPFFATFASSDVAFLGLLLTTSPKRKFFPLQPSSSYSLLHLAFLWLLLVNELFSEWGGLVSAFKIRRCIQESYSWRVWRVTTTYSEQGTTEGAHCGSAMEVLRDCSVHDLRSNPFTIASYRSNHKLLIALAAASPTSRKKHHALDHPMKIRCVQVGNAYIRKSSYSIHGFGYLVTILLILRWGLERPQLLEYIEFVGLLPLLREWMH